MQKFAGLGAVQLKLHYSQAGLSSTVSTLLYTRKRHWLGRCKTVKETVTSHTLRVSNLKSSLAEFTRGLAVCSCTGRCLLTATQLQLSVAESHLSNTSVKSFLQQHAAGDEACISMELQYLSPWNGANLSAARQHSNGHKHNILAMCQVSGMHVSCSVQQAAAYKQPGMPNINLVC